VPPKKSKNQINLDATKFRVSNSSSAQKNSSQKKGPSENQLIYKIKYTTKDK
jgi:hypothetical protein